MIMETKKPCCGIDVSQLTLDVCYQNNLGEFFHLKVGNNMAGFKKILEHTGKDYHFVMEATGVYYIRFAFYLHQQGCALSVVNAMAIKRYIQMHLERNKTDKKDARWICKYAMVLAKLALLVLPVCRLVLLGQSQMCQCALCRISKYFVRWAKK